ncbi:MAG: hypothetical protein Q7R78_00945 [bacterium]|nr:hypothetical protein [bacterium]
MNLIKHEPEEDHSHRHPVLFINVHPMLFSSHSEWEKVFARIHALIFRISLVLVPSKKHIIWGTVSQEKNHRASMQLFIAHSDNELNSQSTKFDLDGLIKISDLITVSQNEPDDLEKPVSDIVARIKGIVEKIHVNN